MALLGPSPHTPGLQGACKPCRNLSLNWSCCLKSPSFCSVLLHSLTTHTDIHTVSLCTCIHARAHTETHFRSSLTLLLPRQCPQCTDLHNQHDTPNFRGSSATWKEPRHLETSTSPPPVVILNANQEEGMESKWHILHNSLVWADFLEEEVSSGPQGIMG